MKSNTESPNTEYKSAAVAALTFLHEANLREFWVTWQEAHVMEVSFLATKDPDYASREHLLRHVFGAARGYMVWLCKQLELPDPNIHATPALDSIETSGEGYLEHLIDRWDGPLCGIEDAQLDRPTYESTWGVHYCIDAMLEHAVMHPIRHTYQLHSLMPSE